MDKFGNFMGKLSRPGGWLDPTQPEQQKKLPNPGEKFFAQTHHLIK